MSVLALHLNDACIQLLSSESETPLYGEPAFALLGSDEVVTGQAAFLESCRHPRSVKNRYLYSLNTRPLTDKRFAHLSPADLLAEQLDRIHDAMPDRRQTVILVLPGYLDRAALGILLGICAELGIQVGGLVDASVAATRREYPGRSLVNIELGLHAAVLSLVGQRDSDVRLIRHEVIEDCGVDSLRTGWMRRIAEEFVRQSRFDPLHSAESEQLLSNNLDDWLAAASEGGQIELSISHQGINHAAVIDSLAFVDAVSSSYQSVADALRATAPAGSGVAVQFSQSMKRFPGLVDYMRARSGAETFVLDDYAAARGALARADQILEAGALRLTTELACDVAAIAPVNEDSSARTDDPTHLLHRFSALTLGHESLVIGSGETGESSRISLTDNTAGISQRHCSVQMNGEGCVVSDHSRYGTYLNGKRIAGSALLKIGDVLRVGTPGIEFTMIKVE